MNGPEKAKCEATINDPLIPESLREVWRWKEAVAKDYEGLSDEEYVRRMNESAERLMKKHGIVLPRRRVGKQRDK